MNLEENINRVLFSNKEGLLREQLILGQENEVTDLISEFVPNDKFRFFRDKTGMSMNAFVKKLIKFASTDSILVAEYDTGVKDWNQKPGIVGERCFFPGCDSTNHIQRDHVIPKFLNKYNQFDFIADPDINFIPLCQFHNRVKTNSILIGLIFLIAN